MNKPKIQQILADNPTVRQVYESIKANQGESAAIRYLNVVTVSIRPPRWSQKTND